MLVTLALLLCQHATTILSQILADDTLGAGKNRRKHYNTVNFTTPEFEVTIWNQNGIDIEESPYIFFTDAYRTTSRPLIVSSKDLSVVYAGDSGDATENARVQQYQGENVFTYWQGGSARGNDQGTCCFFNSNYELIFETQSYDLSWGNDQHECEVTPYGTVLVTVYEPKTADLSAIGGKESDTMFDSCFQEIDIATEKLLFQWCASDHIPIWETQAAYGKTSKGRGWDAYHINSLRRDDEGNYFVSLRRLFAMIKISGKDGSRIWQLGGKQNNFTDLSGVHALDFAWQHHTRFVDAEFTQLTMFDNHNIGGSRGVDCIGPSCSRGVRLELDYEKMTARHLQSFYSPSGLLSYAMGSYHTLPNGNALIGWGSFPEITEFAPSGLPVMNIHFAPLGAAARTYRVYKGQWEGRPSWPLVVKLEKHERELWFWITWNGATEVETWLLYDADDIAGLSDALDERPRPGISSSKDGFETRIVVEQKIRDFAQIAALDKNGVVMGISEAIEV